VDTTLLAAAAVDRCDGRSTRSRFSTGVARQRVFAPRRINRRHPLDVRSPERLDDGTSGRKDFEIFFFQIHREFSKKKKNRPKTFNLLIRFIN